MYLARAFERHAEAMAVPAQRGVRPPQRSGPSTRVPAGGATPAAAAATTVSAPSGSGAATPARQFCRLSLAKMQERHRQGLCYNCDEQYVRGHVCPRLFYLESGDFIDDEGLPATDGDAATPLTDSALPKDGATTNALVVSVHALAGIRTYHTMLLPVTIKGERLLALLDTGSTHTFL